jgi:hypothetical protein
MTISEEEWQRLKFIEIGGMIGKLTVRLDNLEKVVDKFVGEVKTAGQNTERLRFSM